MEKYFEKSWSYLLFAFFAARTKKEVEDKMNAFIDVLKEVSNALVTKKQ